jgi:hypothetical protein
MLEKNSQIKQSKNLRLKWLGLLTIVMAFVGLASVGT